ncbi:MAG: hypothetical protein HY717_05010 [Planctomycetes bacterium]|nr:hypothetical protein [Planctomycetota bacterium]
MNVGAIFSLIAVAIGAERNFERSERYPNRKNPFNPFHAITLIEGILATVKAGVKRVFRWHGESDPGLKQR